MTRIISSFVFLLLAVRLSAGTADSLKYAALGLKLSEYYQTLKYETPEVQIRECDFLIDSATDSLMRQFIALDIYRYYLNSPVMGSENVAVHVFDKWIGTGKVSMKNDRDFMAAKVYSEFNRSSLIGKKAPELIMETTDGQREELFNENDPSGVYRILYFYDTECPKCRIETMLLGELFDAKSYPVEFYAIYAGDKRQAWESYMDECFPTDWAIHLWDPELESDFQRKYGVTKTPRLFLIGPDEVIIGRGLDAGALETLLDGIFTIRPLDYGSSESVALFDGIFASSSGTPTAGQVKGIADYIHDRTLATGDTLMFRQMSGDYLYYLASRSGEGYREGLKYHMERNIFSQDKVWTSRDDSLKVIGFAEIMSELVSKSAPGTQILSIAVPGELYSYKYVKKANVRLDRLIGKTNVIIFYTEGCEVCAMEKEMALNLLDDRKMRVFMVNMDRIMDDDPSLASRLMDAFDLTSLPYIIMTDSNGMILRRYMSLVDF